MEDVLELVQVLVLLVQAQVAVQEVVRDAVVTVQVDVIQLVHRVRDREIVLVDVIVVHLSQAVCLLAQVAEELVLVLVDVRLVQVSQVV